MLRIHIQEDIVEASRAEPLADRFGRGLIVAAVTYEERGHLAPKAPSADLPVGFAAILIIASCIANTGNASVLRTENHLAVSG
jgi:hypothetical protein